MGWSRVCAKNTTFSHPLSERKCLLTRQFCQAEPLGSGLAYAAATGSAFHLGGTARLRPASQTQPVCNRSAVHGPCFSPLRVRRGDAGGEEASGRRCSLAGGNHVLDQAPTRSSPWMILAGAKRSSPAGSHPGRLSDPREHLNTLEPEMYRNS